MRKQWTVIAIALITLAPPLVANMYGIERPQDLEGTWPIGPIICVLVTAWYICLPSSARIAIKRRAAAGIDRMASLAASS